jgi:hypothetical protein
MNYILFHKGEISKNLIFCVNSIFSSDKNAEIHILTDNCLNLKGVKVVHINDFDKTPIADKLKTSDNKSLKEALEKIYYINKYIKESSLNKFIHFDSKVILYQPFSKIKNHVPMADSSINITPLSYDDISFGYSFINSQPRFQSLQRRFEEVLENSRVYSTQYNKDKTLNEMRALSIIKKVEKGLISDLPTLPYDDKTYVFDPASYGLFLDGTNQKPKKIFRKGVFSPHHIVGLELSSKRIGINFNNGEPNVTSELGKKSLLANIYVYSGRMNKFLPNNYIEYV